MSVFFLRYSNFHKANPRYSDCFVHRDLWQYIEGGGKFKNVYHIFSNLIRTSFCRFLKRKKS